VKKTKQSYCAFILIIALSAEILKIWSFVLFIYFIFVIKDTFVMYLATPLRFRKSY